MYGLALRSLRVSRVWRVFSFKCLGVVRLLLQVWEFLKFVDFSAVPKDWVSRINGSLGFSLGVHIWLQGGGPHVFCGVVL